MSFAQMSDSEVVGYINPQHAEFARTAAVAEMQRRVAVAIREFNSQSTAQTAQVITLTENLQRLTHRLFWLGVVQIVIAAAVGLIGFVQLWTMLKGGS